MLLHGEDFLQLAEGIFGNQGQLLVEVVPLADQLRQIGGGLRLLQRGAQLRFQGFALALEILAAQNG